MYGIYTILYNLIDYNKDYVIILNGFKLVAIIFLQIFQMPKFKYFVFLFNFKCNCSKIY